MKIRIKFQFLYPYYQTHLYEWYPLIFNSLKYTNYVYKPIMFSQQNVYQNETSIYFYIKLNYIFIQLSKWSKHKPRLHNWCNWSFKKRDEIVMCDIQAWWKCTLMASRFDHEVFNVAAANKINYISTIKYGYYFMNSSHIASYMFAAVNFVTLRHTNQQDWVAYEFNNMAQYMYAHFKN